MARGSIFRRLFRDVTLTLMFSIRIDDLTFEHVNDFCQARPREGLTLDYKLNFPRRPEKTIASFANTYGAVHSHGGGRNSYRGAGFADVWCTDRAGASVTILTDRAGWNLRTR